MFKFWQRKKKLSKKETRDIIVNAITIGCLIIGVKQGFLNREQSYLIVHYNSEMYKIDDKDKIAYWITDHLAKMHNVFEFEHMNAVFNNCQVLPKNLRRVIVFMCLMCAYIGRDDKGEAMNLVGHFTRELGLNIDDAESQLYDVIQKSGINNVMSFKSNYKNSYKIIQKAVKRTQINF